MQIASKLRKYFWPIRKLCNQQDASAVRRMRVQLAVGEKNDNEIIILFLYVSITNFEILNGIYTSIKIYFFISLSLSTHKRCFLNRFFLQSRWQEGEAIKIVEQVAPPVSKPNDQIGRTAFHHSSVGSSAACGRFPVLEMTSVSECKLFWRQLL